MTDPLPGADDARARLDAAQAAAAQAAADVARAEKPKLDDALAALAHPNLSDIEAGLRSLHARLTDEDARQAIANVWLILGSTRATVRARVAATAHAIELAPAVKP